jgi:hypothetical protein
MKKQKQIRFDLEFSSPDEVLTPRVLDYPIVAKGAAKMTQRRKDVSGQRVAGAGEITILFDYPITRAVEVTFKSKKDWTLRDLFRCIYKGYRWIYASEKNPSTLSNSYNRAKSKGPFGVHSHYLGELWLEGITQTGPTAFELSIGS